MNNCSMLGGSDERENTFDSHAGILHVFCRATRLKESRFVTAIAVNEVDTSTRTVCCWRARGRGGR